MALNNENKSLVQFGYGFNETTSKTAGMISFDSSAQAIYVGDGEKANLVTSSVKNVDFNTESKVLTITKLNGDTQTLDFSDVASAGSVNSLLATLRTDINKNASDINDVSTRVNNLDASYKAADASLQEAINSKADASTAALKSDVSALSNKFDTSYGELTATDTSLRNDISALQQAVGTDGTVAEMINNAIGALDSSKASTGGNYVAVDVSIVDGKLTEVKVNDSGLNDTVNKAASAVQKVEKGVSNETFVTLGVNTVGEDVSISLDDSALNEKITEIDSSISSLKSAVSGGVHFRGVVKALPWDGGMEVMSEEEWDANPSEYDTYEEYVRAKLQDYQLGDIIIVSPEDDDDLPNSELNPSREYILVAETPMSTDPNIRYRWEDLGDTTAEMQRITAIEDSYVKTINTADGTYVKLTPDAASKNDVTVAVDDSVLAKKITDIEAAIEGAVAGSVASIGGEAGIITLRNGQTANGAVNLSMGSGDKAKEIQAEIVGLKSAAFTDATDYATAAQGALADSAIQSITFTDGSEYINVNSPDPAGAQGEAIADLNVETNIADASNTVKKLADAYAVKTYVDSQVTAAALRWTVL